MALRALRDGDPARIGGYRLTARLGAGGMGVVYLGTAKDGTRAAVKVLRPELADDLEFRARFRREVATLTRVDGICAVRVLEADTESDRPFMATEYAPGPTLAEHVTASGPLTAGMLTGLAVGLAEALAAIHAAGVIHRDLKPGNVVLTPSGPKVIDFGIAQVLDATSVTRAGLSVGSPGFMAPEQVRGQAGQPADIFAWGLTVAYAASGRSPFGTAQADVIFYRILHDSPNIAAVPEPLRSVVAAAVARDPGERPAATELLRRLASQAGEPAAPADTTRAFLARTWLGPAARPPETAIRRPRRHGRTPVVLGMAAVLAVIGTGLGVTMAGSGSSPVPPIPLQAYSPVGTPVETFSAEPSPSVTASGPWEPPGNVLGTLAPPPPTAVPATGTWPDPAAVDSSAVSRIEQYGYVPYQQQPSWDGAPGALNAVVAHPSALAGGGERVFFFVDSYAVGADTADGSNLLTVTRVSSTEIRVHYWLYRPGEAKCCPTGGTDVRFESRGEALVVLDPVPSSTGRN